MVGVIGPLELRRIVQAEIRRDVHGLHAVIYHGCEHLGAGPAGQRREDKVHGALHGPGYGKVQSPQVRKDLRQALARGAASGHRCDLGLGVSVQDAGQLGAGVSRDIDDTDLHVWFLLQ